MQRSGMDHDSALSAAHSLEWDDDGRLVEDDFRPDY